MAASTMQTRRARPASRHTVTWAIQTVREAAVAPADVFMLYADPSTWSEWGHNAKWARADGPLVEGGTVHVRANYGKVYPCRIRRLVADRALVLEVRPPLLTVIQTYEVEERPKGPASGMPSSCRAGYPASSGSGVQPGCISACSIGK